MTEMNAKIYSIVIIREVNGPREWYMNTASKKIVSMVYEQLRDFEIEGKLHHIYIEDENGITLKEYWG